MSWRDFLTDAERDRIEAIPAERTKLTDEYKAIYNRARTRMYRAGTKAVKEKPREKPPAKPQES